MASGKNQPLFGRLPDFSDQYDGRAMRRLIQQLEAARVPTDTSFTTGQILPDQNGANAVLTFTFTAPVGSVTVISVGGASRADPFGGTPTSTVGIPCPSNSPVEIDVQLTTLKVWAPAGAVVSVFGLN